MSAMAVGAVNAPTIRAQSCKQSRLSVSISQSRYFRSMAPTRKATCSSAVSWKRRYVLTFFQKLPPCLVGIEACASAPKALQLGAASASAGASSSALKLFCFGALLERSWKRSVTNPQRRNCSKMVCAIRDGLHHHFSIGKSWEKPRPPTVGLLLWRKGVGFGRCAFSARLQ